MAAKPTTTALTGPDSIPVVTREEIAKLAYTLWMDRGCPHGSPEQDWFEAEAFLRALTQPAVEIPDPVASAQTSAMLGR